MTTGILLLAWVLLAVQARPQTPTPKAAAPIDLTGYWVSIVTEDWRYRMVTPPKGDFQSIPVNEDAVRVANTWDPAADDASGNRCKSYGAPALMRMPGRVRVAWQDENTLRVDTEAGTQTRLLQFRPTPAAAERSLQGDSAATWQSTPGGRGQPPRGGSLKVVTTKLRAGYLRKNGVPYSENAVLTEYYDIVRQRNGDQLLVVTAVVDDPQYLQRPYFVSTHFRKQAEGAGWEPAPCSTTW
jgi:hypothetical protein